MENSTQNNRTLGFKQSRRVEPEALTQVSGGSSAGATGICSKQSVSQGGNWDVWIDVVVNF